MSDTIRLLECRICNTVEELPAYGGPTQYDDTLEYAAARHRHPEGENGQLYVGIPAAAWRQPSERTKILELLRDKSGKGLGDDFYNVSNTLREDALACFTAHRRPTLCIDYRDDSKRLLPDTAALRKEAGLAKPKDLPATRFLCDFCPVQSTVSTARDKAA
ncbi:hypothetical protein [Actinomadura atramentaria]|uniref:hypothetical protein n=1 Tax=Actinomadura atramentaria TaxID=1990 RepID=UPI00036A6AD1|nr:hypothetical protein [Actinomadura atramentaria]